MDSDFNGDSADSETGRIDYLRIRRKKTVYKTDNGKSYYGGNTFPRNKGETSYHKSMCYLALAGGINASYQPQYNQTNLGVGGMAAINALNSGTNFESLAGTIQDAAAAILPEFAAGAITQGANAVSGFFGVQGNLTVNALEGLRSGRVFNPYIEQIFSQMNFRSHSFSFKMAARNVKEAEEIRKIIKYINIGAHPKVEGVNQEMSDITKTAYGKQGKTIGEENKDGRKGVDSLKDFLGNTSGGGLSGNRFFGIPDQYELAFMRMRPKSGEFDSVSIENNSDGKPLGPPKFSLHYKMDTCVCSGFSVNYTPDNTYTALKRINGSMIQVPAVVMQVNFTEVRLLNQSDIRQGY